MNGATRLKSAQRHDPDNSVKMSMATILEMKRAAFLADGIPDLTTRIDRISRLQAMILENGEDLSQALMPASGRRKHTLPAFCNVQEDDHDG